MLTAPSHGFGTAANYRCVASSGTSVELDEVRAADVDVLVAPGIAGRVRFDFERQL